MMLVMNSLNYDSMTVGNHEYNFGLNVLEKARKEAKFPWLSANTYDIKTGETHYQPYLVRELGGVRIGILGLTTPGIPNWDNPPNYAGLEFHNPILEAKKWVPILRTKEKVDLVVSRCTWGSKRICVLVKKVPGKCRMRMRQSQSQEKCRVSI
jgi:5''-nucleotidase/2'',3''-cyclic phosphodiesterase and related esterases